MAEKFNFNDPLKGIDPYKEPLIEEEEEDDLEQPERFDFSDPLKKIDILPRAPGVPSFVSNIAEEVLVKPILGVGLEAEQRRPGDFMALSKYLKNNVLGAMVIRERGQQIGVSQELQQAEYQAQIEKGETKLPSFDKFDIYKNANVQVTNRLAYLEDSEYKTKVDEELAEARSKFDKEWTKIDKKIRKKQKEADVGNYGRSLSSGAESATIILGAMATNALTFGTATPLVTAGVLGYFGAQTQAAEYAEARRQGLDHNRAKTFANLQGLSEVLTESIPVARFLKPISQKTLSGVVKRGLLDTAAEVSTENLNTIVQELNTIFYGLESELGEAWNNMDNPLYDGRSVSEVLLDMAGHTTLSSLFAAGSLSSLRATGGAMFTDEVKSFVQRKRQDPNIEEFVKQFETLVQNSEIQSRAVDDAAVKLLDPDFSASMRADEVVAESILNSDFIQIDSQITETLPAGADIITEDAVKNKLPQEEKSFDFNDPLGELDQKKKFAEPETSELDSSMGPEFTNYLSERFANMSKTIPSDSPIMVNTANESLIDTVKSNIVVAKSFPYKKFMPQEDQASKERFFNYRDLNDQEINTTSEAVSILLESGMPVDIFTDIDFIGGLVKDNRKPDQISAMGAYVPSLKALTLSAASGIRDGSFSTESFKSGRKIALLDTMSHELAHHIDFTLGKRNFLNDATRLSPMSIRSPLFDIPKIKNNGITFEVQENTGGAVMQELLSIYQEATENEIIQMPAQIISDQFAAQGQNYFGGMMLEYPFKELVSYGDELNANQLDMIKAEAFAQAYDLYYTNRELLKTKAPRTFKLIEEVNDAISVDSPREKNAGLYAAFQAPGSPRGAQVPTESRDRTLDRRVSATQTARSRVGEQRSVSDRDDIRSEVPELNYQPIGELQKKKDGTYDGAPKTKSGAFLNTQEDFDNLVDKMVGFAQEKELSLPEQSRDWYRNAMNYINEYTRGDAKLKEDVTRLFVIYSSQTPLETNIAYVLRSLVAMAKGKSPTQGFQSDSARYAKEALVAEDFGKGLSGVADKLQSFYDNMTGTKPNSVTMDTWMFKMMGFQEGQNKTPQHRYGTAVVQAATKKYNEANSDNMTPMEFQAVLWTHARNKKLVEQGKQPEYIGYETYLDQASATVTTEVIPTPQLKETEFAEQLPEDVKVQMTRELLDIITTEEGKNQIMELLPGTGLYKFSHSFGAYDGKVNPNIISSLILEKTRGTKQFNNLDMSYADDFLRAWGYVFRQEAMPYFQSNENVSDQDANDLTNESVNLGSEIVLIDQDGSPIEITNILRNQINEALEKEGINGFTQLDANKISVINFKFNNSRIENFNEKLEKAMAAVEIEGVGFDVAHDIKYNTQYLSNNWQENPDGKNYIQGRLEKRSIREGLDRIRSKVDEVYAKYREGRYDSRPNGGFPSTGSELIQRPLGTEVPQMILRDTIEVPEFDVKSLLTSQDAGAIYQAYSTFQEFAVDKLDRLKSFQDKLRPYLPEDIKDLDIIESTDTMHGKVQTGLDDAVAETKVINELLAKNNISIEEFNKFLKNLHAHERNEYINNLYRKQLPELQDALAEELKKKQAKQTADKIKETSTEVQVDPTLDLYTSSSRAGALRAKINKIEEVLDKFMFRGSGIASDVAVKNLKKLGIKYDLNDNTVTTNSKKGKVLMQAFDLLKDYQQKTLDIYKRQDLVSEDALADWQQQYRYYVPLVGFAVDTIEESSPQTNGGGRSLFGSVVPGAKGRTSEAGSPFEQAVIRRSQAIVLGEKNKVHRDLAQIIRAFPEDSLWEIRSATRFSKPQKWDGRESLVPFKEDGKTKFLVLKDSRLAQGFDNWGNASINSIVQSLRGLTGMLSAVYTTLSPEFVATNFLRDYQTGLFNLVAEQDLEGGRAFGEKLMKYMGPNSVKENLKTLRRGYVTKDLEKLDPENYKYFRLFLENGGSTGYINAKTIDGIQKEMLAMSDAVKGKPKGIQAGFRSVKNLVSGVNNVAENSARFSAFKGYIKAKGGLDSVSQKEINKAAALSKNLTINFNRSGRMGPVINSLYVFANASVQGSVNFFRGLNPIGFDDKGNIKWRANEQVSKTKAYAASGIVGFGAAVAMFNTLVSEEDEDGILFIDKIPDHEKERFLIIMIPGAKNYRGTPVYNKEKGVYEDQNGRQIAFAFPLPYGYNVLYTMGRLGVELGTESIVGYKRKSLSEAAVDMAGAVVGSFSPIAVDYAGQGASIEKALIKTFTPSIAKPIVSKAMNEKWTGAPVYKEQIFGATVPQSGEKLANTQEFYRTITRTLNRFTGGGKFDKGGLDLSPDVIKFYAESYLGGLFVTGTRTADYVAYQIEKSQGIERNIPLNEIPFGRIFTAEPEDYTDAIEFYRHKDFFSTLVTSYKNYKKDGDKEALEDFIKRKNFKKDYILLDQKRKDVEKELKALREREILAEKLKEKDLQKYNYIIEDIDVMKNKLHKEFNSVASKYRPR